MKIDLNVWIVTLLLSFTAGFCDTATFVAADQIFSAHVTGNFIVFAYEVISGSDKNGWIKLSTFPLFIFSVILGGWIVGRSSKRYILLLAEGVILIIGGLIALSLQSDIHEMSWVTYLVVMLVVTGMGLQNAFGRIFSKETFGPTTVMTGNVTQAALDIYGMIKSKLKDAAISLSFKKQLAVIVGFLVGCLNSAIIVKFIGLGVVVLPGMIIMIVCFSNGGLKSGDMGSGKKNGN